MLTLNSARRALFVVAAIGLCGVSVAGAPAPLARETEALAPELSGLGTLHVPVSTAMPRAQRFFDQGMRLLYAFNHAESIRAFREAARLDRSLAMAYWGQALALGPNLNAPMTADSGRAAYAAIQAARAAAPRVTPRERSLIEALASRYAPEGAGDRPALDRAYAAAMQNVAGQYPDDPDVQTLYADAAMNTMPWDYWQKDGTAKPETARILDTLERTIARYPDHAGALHYHIHLVEASNDPDRAERSADRLGSLMPAAGHVVHMPAHIYIRVGRYADAADANERAILADEDYLAQCQAQGLYPVSYYPHNLHFLWAAATLEGRGAVAIDAARKVAAKVPHHHAGALSWTADFPVTPMLAYARFGRWQDVLTEPKPPSHEPYAIGIWHYGRGLAFVARGQLDRAGAELTAVKTTMKHEAFETRLKDLPLLTNLQIASRILEGELTLRGGDAGAAIAVLREAVAIEDGMPYSEPPVWHHPPRQVLGAMLLETGRAVEAEVVYREDLQRFRENGWSLFGLRESLRAQHRGEEAADVQRRFDRAWTRADVTLTSSRIMTNDLSGRSVVDAKADRDDWNVTLPTGVRLNYVERGDPRGTPVVLLHGYSDSRHSYDRILPLLPSSFHVFAVTHRGHGDSGKPDTGYTSSHFAADLAAFLDTMRIESAVIVGHSMGSTVAQRFAIDYPSRTRALVLEGAFFPSPHNEPIREFFKTVSAFTDPLDVTVVREFQQSTLVRPVPSDFFERIVNESLKVPARVWKAALEPYLTVDFSDRLTDVAVPTLLVWGDRDAFTARAEQDRLNRAIARSRLTVYSGTGHCPHWEEPERFAADVVAFVRSADAP
ncbi:MAG TPA: alpha/beta hydrolase [Vicinamibacterales bacterium]|nr:alpha/beta hydrolase [Vicinamibacterales bacterium]